MVHFAQKHFPLNHICSTYMQKKIVDRIELFCHFKETRPFSRFILHKDYYKLLVNLWEDFATDEMNKDMNLNKTYTEVFLQSKKKYTFNQVKQTFGLMFHIRRYSTLNIVFAPINYILHQLMGLLFVATIVDWNP